MKIEEYVEKAQKTSNTEDFENKITNAALGMAGEVGEIIDHVKKWKYQGHELNKDEIINEIGDVFWYIAELTTALDTDWEYILDKNIEKLNRRFPNGFDSEKSINR